MNTSKQVNVMIGVVFVSFLLFTGYMVNEANRQHVAREEITHRIAERGARLYVNNCRGCHGLEGEGHVAPALNSKAFLVLGEENSYGAEPTPQGEADAVHAFLFNTMACGRTNTFMPTWAQRFGGPLSDTQINQLTTLITEGRWDIVREIAAEHDPALFAEAVAGIGPLPAAEELAKMPREERRTLVAERDEAILKAQKALALEIEHGNYPDVMKKGKDAILVQDASTLSLTEKNCGQFTADNAQDIKGRDPTVAAAAVPTPGGGGTPAPTAAAGSPAALGKTIATQQGCAACHSAGGASGVGPTWKGIAGSTATFTDGSTAVRDDAYLRDSIANPDAKVVRGFTPGIMPKTFGTSLTPAQIDALIEYMKTLK
jgi:cytochrome c1